MSFLQRIAVLASRKLYFHGTSSKFLRSIMKQGLLPEVKEGVWRGDAKEMSIIAPDIRSFGGSYWAETAFTALRYARDAKRKFGFNELIVAASLETKTALPDEDDFLSMIERGVAKLWGPEYSTTGEYAVMFNYLSVLLRDETSHDIIKNWRNIFLDYVNPVMGNKKYQTQDFFKALDALLLAELTRRVAYFSKDGLYGFEHYKKQALERLGRPRDEVVEQPAPSQGEQGRRQALDLLMRKIRRLVDREQSGRGTLRVLTPVKFSGANKITMVLEAIEEKKDDKTVYKFKVHYGKLEPSFISTWKEMMGYDFEVV